MTNETPKAAQAFHEYCLLGPTRSLRKLAESNQTYSKSIALLMKWSTQYDWQERIKVYDAERAEEQRIKREAEIDAMNQRHVMIGTTHQAKAIKQIEALIQAQKFGSQAVVALLKLAVDVERDARGVNVKKLEVTGKDGGPIEMQRNTDLQNLNDEELEQVERILLQAKERDKQD